MSSYAGGNFGKAIDELNALSKKGSRKSKAKAKRLAAAVERFKNLYTPAMVAAKSFRSPAKTVKSLREARKLDASISGAYSKRIRKSSHDSSSSRPRRPGQAKVRQSRAPRPSSARARSQTRASEENLLRGPCRSSGLV